MGTMGEKWRNGELNKAEKIAQKTAGKIGRRSASIEAIKEALPGILKLRLFVGGLGPTVGASDLQQRFAPLGTVHRIDLVEGKKGWDAEEALQRGFAYVDFEASSEASLRKLFSAYNGCKWKGGVLRVEKAKEHYLDRLRREWAETEAEAALKARLAEKAAANDFCHSRHMYSSKCEDDSENPESNKVDIGEDINDGGDGVAVDAVEIAAQIEKERKKHLDLLTKLFPEDKDVRDEGEKVIEIAHLRAFPMPSDVNAKKRKHALVIPSHPVASSSVQPIEEESRGASVLKSSALESETLDLTDNQKSKNRRVMFSEEIDELPIESSHNKRVTTTGQPKDSSTAATGVRSILKKTQEDSPRVDLDSAEAGNEEERDEEEEEEDCYPSSRSPSPEEGLTDESKWERLFKYASLKKGPLVSKPSASVATTLDSGLSVWTGINLDDDLAEPAVAEDDALHPDAVKSDGLFSGILSKPEDEDSNRTLESLLGVPATVSVKPTQRDGVGSDGIRARDVSDSGEYTEVSQPSVFGRNVQDGVAMKKSRKSVEAPEICSDTLSDQGEESSDFEGVDEDTLSDASSDSEMDEDDDEEEDEDEDMGNFVDAAPARKSLPPTPLNEVATASKWAKMFKSATSGGDSGEGVFSGSLDESGLPGKPRAAAKTVQKMFESAAASRSECVTEAPKVSDVPVSSGLSIAANSRKSRLSERLLISETVMENASRRSSEKNASPSSDNISNHDVAKTVKDDTADTSEEDEAAGDQQAGVMSGNLLARFNTERDEPQTTGAELSEDLQPVGLDPGNERDRVSGSVAALPGVQNAVDDNTKWMQRATWKSLIGTDGRATFSLKQLTGESETTKSVYGKRDVRVAVREQSFNAFSFNFARKPTEASESKLKPVNTEWAEKKPNAGSCVSKIKPAKVLDDEAGLSFMKSGDAEKEWRAARSELRMDSKAKHKAAVRKMKKMKGSVGAR